MVEFRSETDFFGRDLSMKSGLRRYCTDSHGPLKASEFGTLRLLKAADTVLVVHNNDMFD